MSIESNEANFSNCTVLVVDDAADSLSLISDTLEQADINTLVALDGKQALSIANSITPDLILLDAIMPKMDGFETCQELKKLPKFDSVPVMFMTGLSDTESIVKGLSVGGVDYLTKPVNPNELLARMKVHLSNAALAQSAYQALDKLGQFVITVDRNAKLDWATPDSHALLARINWQDNQDKVQQWLAHKPVADSRLVLNATQDESIEIIFIEKRDVNQLLLRIAVNSPHLGAETLQQKFAITKRESEVLYWLANGKSNKEIAEILSMSVRTANKHLEQVFPKLGVENRTAAAGMAIRKLS